MGSSISPSCPFVYVSKSQPSLVDFTSLPTFPLSVAERGQGGVWETPITHSPSLVSTHHQNILPQKGVITPSSLQMNPPFSLTAVLVMIPPPTFRGLHPLPSSHHQNILHPKTYQRFDHSLLRLDELSPLPHSGSDYDPSLHIWKIASSP